MSLAILSSKGSLSHLYFPQGVLNVVSRLLARSSSTCQYPDVASLRVLYLELASSGSMLSSVLEYHWFLSIALLRYFGSSHSLRLPSGFITNIVELIHFVFLCMSVIVPSLTSLSNSVLYAGCMATGTDLGGCCTDFFQSKMMWSTR